MAHSIHTASIIVPAAPVISEAQLASYNYGTTTTYGSNVTAAWTYATGANIAVALIDDGFTAGLLTNFSGASQSFGAAGVAEPTGGYHGTTTSALVGGSGHNGAAIGIAPNANVVGLKVDFGNTPLSEFTAALAAGSTTAAVINNSWAFAGYGAGEPNQAGSTGWYSAVQSAVTQGRGSLGDVVVFAAGNDRLDGNDVGLQPIADDVHVIAVAASQLNGTVAAFSNPGAGLLVATVGQNVAVTLPTGANSYGSGTSYAAPGVSAITSLMLSANPRLGWRDVQEILADSAYAPAPSAAGFTTNHATDVNGGGMHFSDDLGFGIVDANVAVNLARAWTEQSTSANLDTVTQTQSHPFGVSVNGTGVSTLVDASNERIQHVQVQLTDTGVLAADTTLVLVSPEGTRSVLLNDAGLADGADHTGGLDLSGDSVTSNAFWGENAAGTWTLQVQDSHGSVVGSVQDWSLTVTGDAGAGNAPLVFTAEFAAEAAHAAARTVVGGNGATTIDLIGLNNSTELNLNGGAGMIDGVGVTLQAGLHNANADGSTGLVDITAATTGSQITGGDGSTVVFGSGGADTVTAGHGATVVWSKSDSQMTFNAGSGTAAVHGGQGTTQINVGTGADTLVLSNGAAGGLNVISGFHAGLDTVHLIGYSSAAAAFAVSSQTSDGHGGSLMHLTDGSRIDFLGVAHVNQSVFA